MIKEAMSRPAVTEVGIRPQILRLDRRECAGAFPWGRSRC